VSPRRRRVSLAADRRLRSVSDANGVGYSCCDSQGSGGGESGPRNLVQQKRLQQVPAQTTATSLMWRKRPAARPCLERARRQTTSALEVHRSDGTSGWRASEAKACVAAAAAAPHTKLLSLSQKNSRRPQRTPENDASSVCLEGGGAKKGGTTAWGKEAESGSYSTSRLQSPGLSSHHSKDGRDATSACLTMIPLQDAQFRGGWQLAMRV